MGDLGISLTWNGEAAKVIVGISLQMMRSTPSGGQMLKRRSIPAKKRNISCRARSSPRHDLRPTLKQNDLSIFCTISKLKKKRWITFFYAKTLT